MTARKRKPPKSWTLSQIRRAVADYMYSEGCSCCRDTEAHEQAAEVLAKLLRVPRYQDDSGYNFAHFRSRVRITLVEGRQGKKVKRG